MITPETIADALGGASRKSNGGFLARCPAHDDSTASLSIDHRDGNLLVKCMAGCDQGTVIDALKGRSLWPEKAQHVPQAKKRIVATYDYLDETGKLVFQATRSEPKGFSQRRPDGKGGFVHNLDGVALVPYNLPAVMAADCVAIVEGEKDVDNLKPLGITASCNPMGAGKWRESYNRHFAGKRVVIFADNDEPGRKHAQDVACHLRGVASSVSVVHLQGLPVKGDVSDWLTVQGNDKDRLSKIMSDSPEWVAEIKPAEGPISGVAGDEAGAPLPLLRVAEKNEPFPLPALPEVIQKAVLRTHEVIQAPLDLVCQSFLAAATLAAQPHVDVLIDGRQSPVSENFLALGVSGERKSAVDRIATGPIKERQHRQTQDFHSRQHQHEAAIAAWENQRKDALKEKTPSVIEALLAQAGEMPKHVQPCHIVSEPTFQGIEKCFAEGRYTLGLFSDEGGKFLGGYAMAKENQANTITGLSKLWDGDPLDRLRVGDSKSTVLTILYGRRFSVHLMLQPVLAGQLFGNSTLTGQGFLSRCLCCWPESTIGTRQYRAVDLAEDPAVQAYNQALGAILDTPLPMHARAEMGLAPRALTLAPAAKSMWVSFHDHIEQSMAPGGDLFPITGFASKTAEHAARIAGVLTFFQNPGVEEIDLSAVSAGIDIAQYYLGEALRLFHSSNDDPLLTLAEDCFRYGMEKTSGVIGLRNLYQSGPNAVRNKDKAMQIMQVLSDHNRAARIPGGAHVAGQHNREAWKLVPLEGL